MDRFHRAIRTIDRCHTRKQRFTITPRQLPKHLMERLEASLPAQRLQAVWPGGTIPPECTIGFLALRVVMASKRAARPGPTVPPRLRSWLEQRHVDLTEAHTSHLPGHGDHGRSFVLTTVPLRHLRFTDHRYNARQPSEAKINEVTSSMRYMGLLTPLTCFFDDQGDEVFLVDGRHRYEALQLLAVEEPDWADRAVVDVKIYMGLQASEVHVASAYLNRTRRNLRNGEYYQIIRTIYQTKYQELATTMKRTPTEDDVFNAISHRELANRNFDLSLGRLVAECALSPSSEGWYPFVGGYQGQRILDPRISGYCPMTAGNLAHLLRPLCTVGPASEATRSMERQNIERLGDQFREHVLEPVHRRSGITGVQTACRHWTLAAFGRILRGLVGAAADVSPFGLSDVDWKNLGDAVRAYRKIMDKQAELIRGARQEDKDSLPESAWAWQTRLNLVQSALERELEAAGVPMP